jgi:AraC-like DNA-binding protein
MNDVAQNMDKFVSHWGMIPRHYPSVYPVQTIGYLPRKTQWVDRIFTTFDFSFILSGRGTYQSGGRDYGVEAPYVITQSMGERATYGPDSGSEYWEELFLIYPPEIRRKFEVSRLFHRDQLAWSVRQHSRWSELVQEVMLLSRHPQDGMADRLDRLCEQLILESVLESSVKTERSREAQAVFTIRDLVQKEVFGWPDFRVLAQEHGMSESTFRRVWKREIGPPPHQYFNTLKIRRSCRYLVETDLSVGEIATKLGYEDVLYFSRKFHHEVGMTATHYRKTHGGRNA